MKRDCEYPRCTSMMMSHGEFALCRNHIMGLPDDVRKKVLNGKDRRKDVVEVLIARGDFCAHYTDPRDCKICHGEAGNKSRLFHMR